MQQEISFGSKHLTYQLQFSQRKTLGIKVHPSGMVAVTAPLLSEPADVKTKVRKKAPWIFKQLDQFQKYRPGTPPRRYINGETHFYLGRQYRLKIVPDTVPSVKAYRGQIFIYSTSKHNKELESQLTSWYNQRARLIFNEIMDSILPGINRYKIEKPVLIIRKMTKRWGSCTPSGKIILNTELMKAPKGCIEYVIMHELCHLVFHNHTKSFYNLLKQLMPDWEKNKLRLEQLLA